MRLATVKPSSERASRRFAALKPLSGRASMRFAAVKPSSGRASCSALLCPAPLHARHGSISFILNFDDPALLHPLLPCSALLCPAARSLDAVQGMFQKWSLERSKGASRERFSGFALSRWSCGSLGAGGPHS